MQEIKRTSVHDFIYNTIAGTQEISIHGAHNQYVREPFYEGTPNDLFDNHIDIANELKGWIAESIWVDNTGVLVITAEGGKTEQWLSDYGKSVANVRASSDPRYSDFKGRVPKKIKDATLEYMDTDGVGLADAFEWACREYAPKDSELWKAWYYNDFRKFIPSAYQSQYLDFKKYPLKYAESVSSSSTIKASSDNSEYVLTAEGRRKVEQYVRELDAKRKEILDAGKDTIDETPDPVTVEDIVSDLNWGGVDENGEYLNGWYVTDNYDSDYPICLQFGIDFIEK